MPGIKYRSGVQGLPHPILFFSCPQPPGHCSFQRLRVWEWQARALGVWAQLPSSAFFFPGMASPEVWGGAALVALQRRHLGVGWGWGRLSRWGGVCSGRGMSEPRVRCGCLYAWGRPDWLGEALSHRPCGLQEVYFLRWALKGAGEGVEGGSSTAQGLEPDL